MKCRKLAASCVFLAEFQLADLHGGGVRAQIQNVERLLVTVATS